MCGLLFTAGNFGKPDGITDENFQTARDFMARRGPDGAGTISLTDPRIGPVHLGHRRLSIVDISDLGAQPMWSDCDRYVITYNGEVYNAPDLRKQLQALGRVFKSQSDTEVIVNGYAEWGSAVVAKLTGMFAFAIWDKLEGCLFAARDRVGIKPLYLAHAGENLALSSDLRVLDVLGLCREIDLDALGAYLILGYVPSPMSIYQGTAKVEPGTTLSWKPGGPVTMQRYWTPPEMTAGPQSPDLDELSDLIDRVTQEHMLSDVPLGVFLSGGLDSSLIASSLTRNNDSVQALTVGYSAAPEEDEAPIALRTAAKLGLPIQRIDLDDQSAPEFIEDTFHALDEPLGYSAIVSQLAVSTTATKAGLKVVLSGDGGDEIFGGYRWYAQDQMKRSRFDRNRLGAIANRLLGPISTKGLRLAQLCHAEQEFVTRSDLHQHLHMVFPALRPDEIGEVANGVHPDRAEEAAITALKRHDAPGLPMKRRLQRIDLMSFCEGSVLPKVDRMSMYASLEVRPPLLDHRIVEWGLSQPISDISDGTPKGAVRALLKQRGLGFLLEEKKRGFSLKGVPQLSQKAMLNALGREELEGTCLRESAGSSLHPNSHSYKMKIQNMYFLSRWNRAVKEKVL